MFGILKIKTICDVCVTVMIIMAGLALGGCGKEQPAPPPVRPAVTAVVQPSAAVAVQTYPAIIEPVDDVNLSFDVQGPLVDFPIQEGDEVSAGQIIGQIRKRDYEISVRQVQAKVDQARAELKKMQAGARPEDIARLEAALRSAQVAFKTNEATLKRMKEAFAQRVATQTELDETQEARDQSAEAVREAQESLNIGKAGARPEDVEATKAQIESLEAQLAAAQAQLDDTTLTAPFDGVITRKFVERYQNVQPKQSIARLVAEAIEVRLDVPEQDVLKKRKEALKLTVKIRRQDGTIVSFPAALKKWSPEADPTTGLFSVYLSLTIPEDDKQQLRVISGMSATVRAEMDRPSGPDAPSSYRVPLEAVFSPSAGKSCVWVVDPKTMTVSLREVSVGEQTDDEIWVTHGLAAGEEILTAGVHYVRDGQKISRLTAADVKEDAS